MTNCVIVVGNPIDGISFFGPFETFNDAHNWAEGLDEYWITSLEMPDER